MNNFELLKVGQPYLHNVQEGVYLEYQDTFVLYLFLPNINNGETESIRSGKAKFGLTEIGDTLFFLYEFKPAIKLSDTPFNMALYPEKVNNLPTIDNKEDGLSLQVIAVDSNTNIVKSLRLIGLNNRFSKKLIEICKKQSKESITQEENQRRVNNVYSRYSSEDLLRFATFVYKDF